MSRSGVCYLGKRPSLVLSDLGSHTLLINQSDREMVFGLDPLLEDYVPLLKFGMLLVRADTPRIFGMAPKAKSGEAVRLFYAAVDNEQFPEEGTVFGRKAGTWIQVLPESKGA